MSRSDPTTNPRISPPIQKRTPRAAQPPERPLAFVIAIRALTNRERKRISSMRSGYAIGGPGGALPSDAGGDLGAALDSGRRGEREGSGRAKESGPTVAPRPGSGPEAFDASYRPRRPRRRAD